MVHHRVSVALLLCAGLGCHSAHAETERSIALILDSSGSMKAALPDGKTRMDAAKTAVGQFVGTLAPATRLAFWAYGHQSPTAKKDCKDTGQLAAFDAASANKGSITQQAQGLQPLGYTPITYALTQVAEGLAAEESASRTVVLVSDGKETCQADPCAAAKALAAADAKLVVHTVGVGVDPVTRSQLQCIAAVARGNYYDANSTSELSSALGKAADAKPKKKEVTITVPKPGKLKMKIAGHFTHEVLDASGKEMGSLNGALGEMSLPAGIYSVKFGNGLWSAIEVKPGETTEIKPGYLEVKPLGSGFVRILEPETGETVDEIFWSKPRATLIPGHFDLKLGNALWPAGVDVKPGEVATIAPGVVIVKAKTLVTFELKDKAGEKILSGDSLGASKLAVPPGQYTLTFDGNKVPEAQRTMDVDLGAGEEMEVKVE